MKRVLALAGITAAALSLSACAGDMYGGGGSWGNGPYAYDGYYDGYYGPIYDGYWGDDGAFYYRGSGNDHHYHRGDMNHFARSASAPGGNFQHFSGTINDRPHGISMPHFSRGGGGGDHHR